MEKRKIDMSKYADMHDEKVIKGKDNTDIVVRNHIPFSDKEAMATEMAERLLVIHDESCVYTSKDLNLIEQYMIAKYYTDIDTEGIEEHDVANFLTNNEMIDEIYDYVYDDYSAVKDMFMALEKAVTKTYEDDHGIVRALRTSFGFLFTGEDVTESMVKAQGVSDTLFNALGALRQKEKESEETIDHGKMSVGGTVINFAKKTE